MKALVSIPRGSIFDTFFTPDNIRLAESLGTVVWHEGCHPMTEEELKERIGDCDVYVSLWKSPALTEEVLACAPRLRLMTHLGSTVVPVVSDALWERGIRVISGFDYYAQSTAEGAIAYILSAQRRIPFYTQRLRQDGIWKGNDFTDGLICKTVGIVGYGSVGRYVARMLSAFHVRIKVYDVKEIPADEKAAYGLEPCSMEELFSTCDVISLHLAYNADTHHMIDDKLLSLIKRDALLVNTARGGIIDQAALTRHLIQHDFRAALDVLETEPIDPSDPLLRLDNVMITPHQAGVTTNLRAVLTAVLLQESADFIDRDIPLRNEVSRGYASQMSKR